MSMNFFGQYLVGKGSITAATLAKAVAMQESANRSFGQTAQLLGFLTSEEVSEINRLQRTQDLLSGDAAIQLGLLNKDQVLQILSHKEASHIFIGEALVKIGALDENRLRSFLDEFEKEQAIFRTNGLELPDGTPCPELCHIIGDTSHKMLSRIAKINFKPDTCELVNKIDGNSIAVLVDFSGDITARYYITFPLHIRKHIALAMISDDHSHPDDPIGLNRTINEIIVNFVTIVCDNIIAKAAQIGIRLVSINSEIIDHDEDVIIPASNIAVLFPVHLYTGEWIDVALVLSN
jgi:hypothetical protein